MPFGAASVTPQISDMKFFCPRYWEKLPMNLFVPSLELVPNERLKP